MINVVAVVFLVAGMASIAAPLVAGGVAVLLVGSFMIASGLVQLGHAFSNISWGQRFVWMVVGALTTLGGAIVVAHPLFGLGFLTLMLAAYFVSSGIVKLAFAASQARARGWLVLSAILSLVLGGLIWSEWPLSGAWAVGTLVGIELIMTGAVMLSAAGPGAAARV